MTSWLKHHHFIFKSPINVPGRLDLEKQTQFIKELDIIPDHVHMFIKIQPIQSSQLAIGQLKGSGSRLLRQEFSSLKSRLSTL